MSDESLWFRPPPRPSRPPSRPSRPQRPERVDVVIDGQAASVPAYLDDPGGMPVSGNRHAHALLPGKPHAGERLPDLRGRTRRRTHAGPGLLPTSRARYGNPDRLAPRAAVTQDGDRVPWLVRGSLHGPTGPGLRRAVRRLPRALRAAATAVKRQRSAITASRDITIRTDGTAAETVAQPVKVDNDLYVRDYGKCILCYKCVEACGTDAQNTFAIAVAGRGFDARISTEGNVPLPESACVYCGNCIGVCPTGALMFRSEYELRRLGKWDESRQTQTDTICPYCGVGCTLSLHVQDNQIVKVTSPLDVEVTHGHLCIKGRFGFEFVHGGDLQAEARSENQA